MPESWLAKAYAEVRHLERERAYWAERERLPGVARKPAPDYPVPLRESQLSALHREACRLGRLAFEGASWFVLSPDGEYLRMQSVTQFHESLSSIDLPELICDAFEANGGCPGAGVIVMHNHPMVERGERVLPSRGDLAAITRIHESLTRAGHLLQDYVIVGPLGSQGWSWRQSIADGEFANIKAVLEG